MVCLSPDRRVRICGVPNGRDHQGHGHVGGGSHDSGKGHNRVKQYLEELSNVCLFVCLFALPSFLALSFSSSVAHADDHHGRGHVGGGSRDSGKGHNRLKQYLEELLYK